MKYLKKITSTSEITQQEYNVVYATDTDVMIKKTKLPNIILYYNDGTIQKYYDTPKMTWDMIKDKPYKYGESKGVQLIKAELLDGTTEIDSAAFAICKNLSSVTLADSIKIFRNNVFEGCNALTEITFPQNVDIFEDSMCVSCKNLKTVTLPLNITSIENYMCNSCNELKTINIPNGVTYIGTYSFGGCFNLTSITYNNTIEQWNAITKGSFWKEYVPSTCIVHCTDGDIPIS